MKKKIVVFLMFGFVLSSCRLFSKSSNKETENSVEPANNENEEK